MLVLPFLRQLWLITLKVVEPENPTFKFGKWQQRWPSLPLSLMLTFVLYWVLHWAKSSLYKLCEFYQNIQAGALSITTFVCASKLLVASNNNAHISDNLPRVRARWQQASMGQKFKEALSAGASLNVSSSVSLCPHPSSGSPQSLLVLDRTVKKSI